VAELEHDLPFVTRIWFAWACFFRVLFDGSFAARAWAARDPLALPEPPAPRAPSLTPAPPAPPAPARPPPPSGAALQLLALFQREGRLIDFLEQDIASFGDAEIGGVARVVHEGCRKALRDHAELVPVRTEEEGVRLTLQAGFDPAQIKLSGNVQGHAPYTGVLRHRGWRAKRLELPVPVTGHDATVIAPAEVEL
jgi:hypothetical protein